MIKLRVMPTRALTKCKQSIFLKFDYNQAIVDRLRIYSKKAYHKEEHIWELHLSYFESIIDNLKYWEMDIGKLPSDLEKLLDKIDERESALIVESTYKYKTKPFDHQRECLQYAEYNNKFLLGDEQGLGKTKQAIDIAIARKSKYKHCLIVCCINGLKWNWQREVATHSNESAYILGEYTNSKGKKVIGTVADRLSALNNLPKDYFIITNIETLRDSGIQTKLEKLCKNGTIGVTIIDEIHKCSNSTSAQGKAIHKLCSPYKLALTGTPLMNTPIDLFNILKWLDYEYHTLTQFKKHYCHLGGFTGYQVTGYKNTDQLQNQLNNVMLRRLKNEVLNLPPKIKSIEYVEMGMEQTKLYNKILQSTRNGFDSILNSPNPLIELIRLRQCTGDPNILSKSPINSAKLDRLEELVEQVTSNGGKVIVFSNWTKITNAVENRLARFNPAIITGQVQNRTEQQDKFQNDPKCKVIIGTIPAMGTGLTLTAANTVIFMDSPWNRATKDQAEDRAHRIGTTGSVNIITLVVKDTIDEKIENIVNSKGELSDIIVDNVATNKISKDTLNYLLS